MGTGDVTISGNNIIIDLPAFSHSGTTAMAVCECQYTMSACYTVVPDYPGDSIVETGTPRIFGSFTTGTSIDIYAVGTNGCTARRPSHASVLVGRTADRHRRFRERDLHAWRPLDRDRPHRLPLNLGGP